MEKKGRISPENEMEVDVCIGLMSEWIKNCPGRCPLSNIFSIIISLNEDRKALLNLLEIKKNQYYE